MPCHGACHSFDDSRKPKTCRLREVPGTWPHPHCSCTPGQCPRILSPFTILHKTDKTKSEEIDDIDLKDSARRVALVVV